MDRREIFAAIENERAYQDEQWGTEFDDKNTINDWVTYIMHYAGDAARMNRETKILDVPHIEKNLLKAATLCVAALETIGRNGKPALRHYDRSGMYTPARAANRRMLKEGE